MRAHAALGRDDLLADALGSLERSYRITLVGPTGAGKSRLARALTRQRSDDGLPTLAVVALAGCDPTDPTAVCSAVTAAVANPKAGIAVPTIARMTAAGGLIDRVTDADAVRTICTHLDGLPLELEVAAGLAARHGVGEVAGLVAAGAGAELLVRGAHPQQRTLLEAIGWSLERLRDDQPLLLAAAASFAGSASVDDGASSLPRRDRRRPAGPHPGDAGSGSAGDHLAGRVARRDHRASGGVPFVARRRR